MLSVGSTAGGGRFVAHRGVFFAAAVRMVARSSAVRANDDGICKKNLIFFYCEMQSKAVGGLPITLARPIKSSSPGLLELSPFPFQITHSSCSVKIQS
jgi:hypothetical protein